VQGPAPHQEFLAFCKHVARAYPDRELHLIMDNYATHPRPEVKAWLAANPRIQLHFTPTSGSWQLSIRPRLDDQDPCLHLRLEHPLPPVHLDQDARSRPRQAQT